MALYPDYRDIGQIISKGMYKEEIPVPTTMLRNARGIFFYDITLRPRYPIMRLT